jgi:TMEM175 potassium channel family protein
MTNGEPPGPLRRGLRTVRLEAVSDGVFAIALLVLDIVVPANAGKDLLRAVADLWPSYLAYVASFSTIGAVWLGHAAVTEYLERAVAGYLAIALYFIVPLPHRRDILPFRRRRQRSPGS